MAKCRSCGAPVLWVTMLPGHKAAPLDEQPHPDGNINVVRIAGHAFGEVVDPQDPPGIRPLYRSHFATCPQAADWRR